MAYLCSLTISGISGVPKSYPAFFGRLFCRENVVFFMTRESFFSHLSENPVIIPALLSSQDFLKNPTLVY